MTNDPFTARVIKPWVAKYPDPITLEPGDLVTLGPADAEFPGWIWAISVRTGRSGWVPESLLEERGGEVRSREHYTARELAVSEGDILVVHKEILGFAWVERDGEQGWVPARHLVRGGDPLDVPL